MRIGRSVRWFNEYEEEVKFSKENNFDFMQIWYLKGDILIDTLSGDKVQKIIDYKFPVVVHGVLDINDFEDEVPKLLKVVKRFSHKNVIIHPLCESEEITDDTIYKLAKKVSYAQKEFSKEGITIYLENNSKLDPINYSVRDLKIMFSQNPNVEMLLDIAHIDSYDHLKDIVAIKYPKTIHLADKRFSEIHEHLPIGEGDLDFEYIFNTDLKDFNGDIIFEIVDKDKDIIESKKIIENIIKHKNKEA